MEHVMDGQIKKRKGLMKALVFVAFIISAIILIRFTPIKDYLTTEALTAFLEGAGIWTPIVFIILYTIGVCLFLPDTLLTGIGAASSVPIGGFYTFGLRPCYSPVVHSSSVARWPVNLPHLSLAIN